MIPHKKWYELNMLNKKLKAEWADAKYRVSALPLKAMGTKTFGDPAMQCAQ